MLDDELRCGCQVYTATDHGRFAVCGPLRVRDEMPDLRLLCLPARGPRCATDASLLTPVHDSAG